MKETWNVLYRGSLSSCNYGCPYCPFAKTRNTRAELEKDRAALNSFVDWVEQQAPRSMGILFTPWGEALVRSYYQEAFTRLSWMPHVYRVAAQTNLSFQTEWLSNVCTDTAGLWATYHPGETTQERFLDACEHLTRLHIRFSVGVVGLKEHIPQMEVLRTELPEHIYLWVNAYKRDDAYYAPEDIERIRRVDPYFGFNAVAYPSRDLPCRAGSTSFTVDAQGDVRRCHFIPKVIGNISDPHFASLLRPTLCTNDRCRCHIGYIHRIDPNLYALFSKGILDRIPEDWPNIQPSFSNRAALQETQLLPPTNSRVQESYPAHESPFS